MADTFRLLLVTPERTLLDEEVDEVTAPGTVGEFGVLPQPYDLPCHRWMLAAWSTSKAVNPNSWRSMVVLPKSWTMS